MRCSSFSSEFGSLLCKRSRSVLLLWVVLSVFSKIGLAQPTPASHERDFWQSIAANHYAIPSGQSAFELSKDLSRLLSSPDPQLRDDLAYSILAHWIRSPQALGPEQLTTLADRWRSNLRVRIGENGTNSVLLRSFSALCLSSIAERELKTPFLGPGTYHSFLNDALQYLHDERDLRGYDGKLGWIHATAHTADLLQALAMNPMLSHEEQARIYDGITERVRTAPDVFSQGEQDRLAQTLLAILDRKDSDRQLFDTWLNAVESDDKAVWQITPLKPERLAVYQNHTYLLQALFVRLSLQPSLGASSDIAQRVIKVLAPR
jgi:Protein of unknown function (DUF2785)